MATPLFLVLAWVSLTNAAPIMIDSGGLEMNGNVYEGKNVPFLDLDGDFLLAAAPIMIDSEGLDIHGNIYEGTAAEVPIMIDSEGLDMHGNIYEGTAAEVPIMIDSEGLEGKTRARNVVSYERSPDDMPTLDLDGDFLLAHAPIMIDSGGLKGKTGARNVVSYERSPADMPTLDLDGDFLLAHAPIMIDFEGLEEKEDDIDQQKAKDYLRNFGYMKRDVTEELGGYERGLVLLQQRGGIEQTGQLDEATLTLIRAPRCGTPDYHFEENMEVPYHTTINDWGKWPKTKLSYRVANMPTTINNLGGEAGVRDIMGGALNTWGDVSKLEFREVSSGEDITLSFQVGDHGDGSSFDGPGTILAHGFFPNTPYNGQAHFDDDENFTTNSAEGINLDIVAVHELGHNLGLHHSDQLVAVMYPWYKPQTVGAAIRLNQDDIDGIRSLYGV